MILIFFISFIGKQSQVSEQRITLNVLDSMDTILKSSALEGSIYKRVEYPRSELRFECEGDYSAILVNGEATPAPFTPFFSTSYLEGDVINAWSMDFNYPYPVSQMLMVSNPDTLFVFVNASEPEVVSGLYNEMPSGFRKVAVEDVSDLEPGDFDTYRIITVEPFDNPSTIILSEAFSSGQRVFRTAIHDYRRDLSYGNVTFYQYFPETEEGVSKSAFITRAGLWAALFSDSADFYECSFNKALKRFRGINDVNYERLLNISGYYYNIRPAHQCVLFYDSPLAYMELVNDSLNSLIDNFDYGSLGDLRNYAGSLKANNEALVRSRNCPLLY